MFASFPREQRNISLQSILFLIFIKYLFSFFNYNNKYYINILFNFFYYITLPFLIIFKSFYSNNNKYYKNFFFIFLINIFLFLN
jgi:hypothetical protein